jgi:hypothetical protein
MASLVNVVTSLKEAHSARDVEMKTNPRDHDPMQASTVVRRAARLIGFKGDLSKVLDALEANDISQSWQLRLVSEDSWCGKLGASIGLSSACRALAGQPPVAEDSTDHALHINTDHTAAHMKPMLRRHTSRSLKDVGRHVGSVTNNLHRRLEAVGEKHGMSGCARFWAQVRALFGISLSSWIFPADHQEGFKECVFASSDPKRVKTYLQAVTKMWVLVMSLLLSTLLRAWNSAPLTTNKYALLVYEIIVGVTVVCLTFSLMGEAVLFILFTATSETNIKAFALTVSGSLQGLEVLLIVTIYATANVFVLLSHIRMRAVAEAFLDNNVCLVLHIMLGLLQCVIIIFCFVHNVFVGRVAMHSCFLSEDKVRFELKDDEREKQLHRNEEFFDYGLRCVDSTHSTRRTLQKLLLSRGRRMALKEKDEATSRLLGASQKKKNSLFDM